MQFQACKQEYFFNSLSGAFVHSNREPSKDLQLWVMWLKLAAVNATQWSYSN